MNGLFSQLESYDGVINKASIFPTKFSLSSCKGQKSFDKINVGW